MQNVARLLVQNRTTPISRAGMIVTFSLAAAALTTAMAKRLEFVALPNLLPLITAVFIVDVLCQLAPQTSLVRAVQTVLYGLLYLVITCFCGVLAAYSTQRFAFPLRDQFLASADHLAFGVNWSDIVHWVDDRPVVHAVLKFAYYTFSVQIALPVIVLAFSDRTNDVKRYLIGFAIALSMTIVVSALLPAASPLAFADQSTFHLLRFTGATPVDDLMRLRSSEPVIIDGGLGGIISFPSFHATVATLTPLTLRRYRVLFFALLILDAAMLCSAITEGAHYVSDIPAGCGVAFAGFFAAGRLVGTVDADRHFSHVSG